MRHGRNPMVLEHFGTVDADIAFPLCMGNTSGRPSFLSARATSRDPLQVGVDLGVAFRHRLRRDAQEENPGVWCARTPDPGGMKPGSLGSRPLKPSTQTDGVSTGRRILDRLASTHRRGDALLSPAGPPRSARQTPSRVMHRVTVGVSRLRTRGCWGCSAHPGIAGATDSPHPLRPRRGGAATRHEPARLPAAPSERRPAGTVERAGLWRIVFRFEDGEATDVTLVDCH